MQFDAAIYKALEKDVTTKTFFKGHLDSYRYCDQVRASGKHPFLLANQGTLESVHLLPFSLL